MNKFLVLGSSGLIGANLCDYLEFKGHIVIKYDIKRNEEEDLRKIENDKLLELVKLCDFIFFVAFDVGGSKYLLDYQKNYNFLNNNTRLMLETFRILEKTGKKFVFTSTYLVNEKNGSYADLKRIGELFTVSLGGLVVRLYNVYGFEKISKRSHVIPDLIQCALTNNSVKLLTDGFEERQFLHVNDCSDGLYSICRNYDAILGESSILDLSSFVWLSIREIAEIISNTVVCKIEYSTVRAKYFSKPPENKLILKFWTPKIDVNCGIKNLIEEYKLLNKSLMMP